MATLDSLPPDQRAVLQLVLQRGRTYDEIAEMLAIDRAAVRQRALDGFDALGPSTSVSEIERSLITDYLLGQLPPLVAEQVHNRLGTSPPQRAWARLIASEISPLARDGLPEIPSSSTSRTVETATELAAAAPVTAETGAPAVPVGGSSADSTEGGASAAGSSGETRSQGSGGSAGESSRRGGAILLGSLAALIVLIIVIVLVSSGGGSANKHKHRLVTTTTVSGNGGTGTSTTVQKLGQINLSSPTNPKTIGIAEIAQTSTQIGMVVVAQNLPANNHNAYGVWLYSGPGQQKFLGFYNGSVGSNGKLEVQTALPANYKTYKQLLVTLETGEPTHPGTIELEGTVK